MKIILLYLMIVLYCIAGINHFVNPDTYLKIMPKWLGWHKELNNISGVCEIAFALMLTSEKTRQTGAWCIIILLVAVFPANIQMLMNYLNESRPNLWLAVLRLPLQGLLIWWAHVYTKPVQNIK